MVSPIAQVNEVHTNLISPLSDNSNISLTLTGSKLSILNKATSSASVVASIDNQGNARLQGDLTARQASFSGQLSAQTLDVNGDASISGTLRAGKIIASNIEGLNLRATTVSAQYITNNYYSSTPSAAPSPDFGLVAKSASVSGTIPPPNNLTIGPYVNIASLSAELAYVQNLSAETATFKQGLMSFGPTSLADTSIAGQLSIGTNLILADTSINVLGSDFEIQPLKQGGVSIMAGLVYIDTDGNLKVGGNAEFAKNVTVNGTLAANIIAPIPNQDLTIHLGGVNSATSEAAANTSQAAQSDSWDGGRLVVKNASNSAVLSLNSLGDLVASGSATIGKLNLGLVQPALALSDTELLATGSAGVATISAQQKEVTIDNNLVTDKSLIYITPVGAPSTAAPFLERQVPNTSFTVGISQPSIKPTSFNWLIVN